MSLLTSVNINQGICGCDGSFAINTSNGTPPYSYSIDGGVSFRNTPFFTNLCFGTYTVIVKDSGSTVSVNTVTLNRPNDPITYLMFTNTTSSTLQNDGVVLTKKYETTVSISPELPNGVYITFDLVHNNVFTTSPSFTSSTQTLNSLLTVNSIPFTATTTGVTTGSTYNPIPSCQLETKYITSTVDVWNNLTYTGGTVFSLTTTSTITKNAEFVCYSSSSDDTYLITNPKIYGCSCCYVITS